MKALTVSAKYQVVIPREKRDALALVPGQRLHVFLYDGRIELVPMRDVKEMRGFLRGLDRSVPRERDRAMPGVRNVSKGR